MCGPNNFGKLDNPDYNPYDDLPGLPPEMFDPPPPDPGGQSDGNLGDAGEPLFPPSGLSCPLILDLDGDGVELTALSPAGTLFDIDADGFAERTG